MGNIFNDDFRDFIAALNDSGVEYLLVGGYAVIIHGYRRTTGDMDIWINPTPQNYKLLVKACNAFGLPILDMTQENFLHNNALDVFTFGRSPVSIDIMKTVKGCDFETAYKKSQEFLDDELLVRYIHLDTLLEAKKASGRYKDLDDIEKLSGL
jgi:hypothetical protein